MAGFLQLSPLDWKYKTEPQGTACLGNRQKPTFEMIFFYIHKIANHKN